MESWVGLQPRPLRPFRAHQRNDGAAAHWGRRHPPQISPPEDLLLQKHRTGVGRPRPGRTPNGGGLRRRSADALTDRRGFPICRRNLICRDRTVRRLADDAGVRTGPAKTGERHGDAHLNRNRSNGRWEPLKGAATVLSGPYAGAFVSARDVDRPRLPGRRTVPMPVIMMASRCALGLELRLRIRG